MNSQTVLQVAFTCKVHVFFIRKSVLKYIAAREKNWFSLKKDVYLTFGPRLESM